MYSYKLFVLLVLVVLLHEGDAKYKQKNEKRSYSSSSAESSSKTSAADCRGMFVCTNSTCIDKNKLCDTHADCGNGEDETDCTEPESCPRVCAYDNIRCLSAFDVPDANTIDSFPLTSGGINSQCQAACNANADCETAFAEANLQINTVTCFLSMQTVTELFAIVDEMVVDCDTGIDEIPVVYFVWGVNQCT